MASASVTCLRHSSNGWPRPLCCTKISARAGLERRPCRRRRWATSLVERARRRDSGSGPCTPRKSSRAGRARLARPPLLEHPSISSTLTVGEKRNIIADGVTALTVSLLKCCENIGSTTTATESTGSALSTSVKFAFPVVGAEGVADALRGHVAVARRACRRRAAPPPAIRKLFRAKLPITYEKNTSGLAAKFVSIGYFCCHLVTIALLIEIFHMVPFPCIVCHRCSEPTLR